MEINVGVVRRPRNVDWRRAAPLLYGDWGTSKAYVTGLAFAAAAFSSFWLVLGVSILTAFVGVNYLWICKYFPDGGGVYSSAKHHSMKLALIGGFFLVADIAGEAFYFPIRPLYFIFRYGNIGIEFFASKVQLLDFARERALLFPQR